jgi:hypothetical protein
MTDSDELKDVSLEDAKTELGNAVYSATGYVERLEYAGKVCGNGHHIRQEIAAAAQCILEERWRQPAPARSTRTKTEQEKRRAVLLREAMAEETSPQRRAVALAEVRHALEELQRDV